MSDSQMLAAMAEVFRSGLFLGIALGVLLAVFASYLLRPVAHACLRAVEARAEVDAARYRKRFKELVSEAVSVEVQRGNASGPGSSALP